MATWAKRECLEEVAYVAPAAERDDVMITTVWTIISTSVTWYMSVSHRRTTGRPADYPLSADQTAEKNAPSTDERQTSETACTAGVARACQRVRYTRQASLQSDRL